MSATDGQPKPAENGWDAHPTEQQQAKLEKILREWEAESDHGDRCGPFDGEVLSRADVFWLVAERNLPKPHLERFDVVGRRLAKAPLAGADLTGAELARADLTGADLSHAHLKGANLSHADLKGTILVEAHMEGVILSGARLEWAELAGADLTGAELAGANLVAAGLTGANLSHADLKGANLWDADLKGADLSGAHLEGANLLRARLEGADLSGARLEGTDLSEAHLEGADLSGAHLEGANLSGAHLNHVTLSQVTFDNTNLAVVKWGEVRKLGNELRAEGGRGVDPQYSCSAAARIYRALSIKLRSQGIIDAARFHYRSEVMERKALFYETRGLLFSWRFYHAPLPFARWLVSWVLGMFMGYGDYISRLFLTYAGVVVAFAAVYLGLTYQPAAGHPLTMLPWPRAFAAVSWVRDLVSFWLVRFPAAYSAASTKYKLDALVFSVTAFHGRGLQVQPWSQQDVVIWWAGVEAVLGLLIEALFVAAFARRVTGG